MRLLNFRLSFRWRSECFRSLLRVERSSRLTIQRINVDSVPLALRCLRRHSHAQTKESQEAVRPWYAIMASLPCESAHRTPCHRPPVAHLWTEYRAWGSEESQKSMLTYVERQQFQIVVFILQPLRRKFASWDDRKRFDRLIPTVAPLQPAWP